MSTGKGISDYINKTKNNTRWRYFGGSSEDGINIFEFEADEDVDEIEEYDEVSESFEDFELGIDDEEVWRIGDYFLIEWKYRNDNIISLY